MGTTTTVRMCFPKSSGIRRVPKTTEVGDRLCAEYSAQALYFVLYAANKHVTLAQVQKWMEEGCWGMENCSVCPFASHPWPAEAE
jgi:hypothetical protein